MELIKKQLISNPVATTLSNIKEHLRINHTDQDNYLTALILVAEDFITDLTGFQLRLTEYQINTNRAAINFPRIPFRSLISYKYRNANNDFADIDSQYYKIIDNKTIYLISNPFDLSTDEIEGVYLYKCRYKAGFSSQINDEQLELIIKLIVGHWYEYNLPIDAIKMNKIPWSFASMIENLKAVHIYTENVS